MDEQFISNPYMKEEKKSLAEIIISQIDKTAQEFSKEMKRGFQYEDTVNGQKVIVTVPDQRKLAINHVKTLHNLMICHFDDEMNKIDIKLNKEIKELEKSWFERYLIMERDPRNKRTATNTKIIQRGQAGDDCNQRYMDEQVEIYRMMFKELILLFKRRNELSGKKTIGYDTK